MYKLNKRLLKSPPTAHPLTDEQKNLHYDSPAKSELFTDIMVKEFSINYLNCATDVEIMSSVEIFANFYFYSKTQFTSPLAKSGPLFVNFPTVKFQELTELPTAHSSTLGPK